jgi:hypothetical protein
VETGSSLRSHTGHLRNCMKFKEYMGFEVTFSPTSLRKSGENIIKFYSFIYTREILSRKSTEVASILCRFCVDSLSILRRFCVDFASILRRFSVDFLSILCRFSVDSLSICWTVSRVHFRKAGWAFERFRAPFLAKNRWRSR